MPNPDTFSLPPRVLANLEIPIERLCTQAGIAPSNAWSTGDFFRLWAVADEIMADRAASLRFGSEGISRGYGVASIVALHAPDLGNALAALSRYKRLTCPERVEVEIAGGEATVHYRWIEATSAVPRLLVDTVMASLRELVRRGTNGKVSPVRLELARRPMDHALLQRHFACPIRFGALHDAMVFDQAALHVPFITADGGAFAHVLQDLEQRLVQREEVFGWTGDVRLAIARQLSEGRQPSIAAIARRLNLSSRTLQRHLLKCQTSFQQQLSDVRHTTACRLLVNTDLDQVAIALLLGFIEPNSFMRAFRRWEQTTPSLWRQHHASNHI